MEPSYFQIIHTVHLKKKKGKIHWASTKCSGATRVLPALSHQTLTASAWAGFYDPCIINESSEAQRG